MFLRRGRKQAVKQKQVEYNYIIYNLVRTKTNYCLPKTEVYQITEVSEPLASTEHIWCLVWHLQFIITLHLRFDVRDH